MDGHAYLIVLLDFFKSMPPLEKPLGQYDQKGEVVVLPERFTKGICQKGAFTSPLVLLMHTY